MSSPQTLFLAAKNHLTTPRDLIRFALSRFNASDLHFGHGSDNSLDEAAYLVLHSLHLPLDTTGYLLEARLLPDEIDAALELIQKRIETRKPAAYLTHEAWQGGFNFYVDERVIVPRSFIARLLGEPLRAYIEHDELVHRALDLCTGSGTLAIQMAHHYPASHIDAVDISLDALEVAAINQQNYGLEDRIKLIHTDLFEGLEGNEYDLIVANPPYVDAPSMEELPDEYRHEPELALASGFDGLDAIRTILDNAPQFLSDNGVLLMEIGHNRDTLETAYPHLPFTWMDTESGDGFVLLLTQQDFKNT